MVAYIKQDPKTMPGITFAEDLAFNISRALLKFLFDFLTSLNYIFQYIQSEICTNLSVNVKQ